MVASTVWNAQGDQRSQCPAPFGTEGGGKRGCSEACKHTLAFGGWALPIYLSIYLYLSVYLSNYLSIYLPFYYLSIDRPIYLSTNIQMAHSHPSQPHLESFGLGTMTFE